MRRIVLIGFQSLMALIAFGIMAYSLQDLSPSRAPSGLALAWVRVVSIFLIGVLFTLYAVRNLLRIGKAYAEPKTDA